MIQILGGDLEEWIKFENVTTNETSWLKVRDTTVELQETYETAMDLFEEVIFHD